MKFKIIIIYLLFIQFVFSQSDNRFNLNLGLQFRLPDVYNEQSVFILQKDSNIKGTNLRVYLTCKLFENFEVGYLQGFQYSYYGKFKQESKTLQQRFDKKILIDYGFFIRKSFNATKNRKISLFAGISYMNVGAYYYVFYPDGTNVKYSFEHIGYNFETTYQYKFIGFGVGYYHIPKFMTEPYSALKVGIVYLSTHIRLVSF